MEIKVKKRNGQLEDYSVQKLKDMISWACIDLEVNPLALESKIEQFVKDEITTTEIHDNLIHYAKTLCLPQQPDWTKVAGRLQTMKRWKDTLAYDISFTDFLNEKVANGEWQGSFFDGYSELDKAELGNYIVQDRDLDHSYASVLTAEQKYLQEGECIQQMFMANAMIIASVEPENSRVVFAKEVYDALSERKISLATPWLSNLRAGGNISSCFIIAVDDNIDSIFDNIKNAAKISKDGGGLGIDLSRIRASGSDVAGRSNASKGVVSWIKIFNDTAVAVDQGGKRAGAFTVALPVWHKDIEPFLDMQTETGDQRQKAYDVFPQLVAHDVFFQTIEDNGTWYTFCPHEVNQELGLKLYELYGNEFTSAYYKCVEAADNGLLKIVRKLDAKKLIKHIMAIQFETGLPYIAMKDAMNEVNPNKHTGYIPCVNLCIESFSNLTPDSLSHTCNLASIVCGRMDDYNDFTKYAALATRILDNGIYLTEAPIQSSKDHNNLYRTIGVGLQGYNDWLAKNYSSYHNTTEAGKVAEAVEFGCVSESIKLAKERGRYPAFKGSMWDTGERVELFAKYSQLGLAWESLQSQIDCWGIRNSQMTSPAPNTSTSIFMDAAAGVMPVYSGFFIEDNKSGAMPVAAMFLKENPLGYRTFGSYDQCVLAKGVGLMQRYVDTGISAEYMFDQNKESFKAKDLYDLIITAWKERTKGIYYIRTIKKGQSLTDYMGVKEEACVACSG